MRKIGIVVAILGIIIGGIGMVAYGAINGSYSSVTVDQTKTIDVKDIKNIQFDSSLAGVHIFPSKSDTITAHLYGSTNRNDLLFTAEANGDTAIIEFRHKNNWMFNIFPFSFFTNQLKIDLELPQKIYDTVQAHSQAGSISMEQVSAGRFDLHSSAGGINVSDAKGDLTANTSAGSMRLTNVDGALDLKDSAGSIEVQLQSIDHDIKANDSAGSIRIVTQKQPEALRFDLRTSAGHVDVNLPNVSYSNNENDNAVGAIGSGGPLVDLQASAGSVSVSQ